MRRLLLISNSTLHGSGYLDHCADAIVEFFGGGSSGARPAKRLVFVPHALGDRDAYAAQARKRLGALGFEVTSLHEAADAAGARALVQDADGIFIGGGNTFRLLNELYAQGLVEVIRARVAEGMPYLGTSAGSNVACVTIKTTNDMPIVYPPSFDALALVPFNINPHYLDPAPDGTHMGESRETRIAEFHERNAPAVVGLREGAFLLVEGRQVVLGGTRGARLFRQGQPAEELVTGTRLDALLDPEQAAD